MKNSTFYLYLNKSDQICQLFINVILLFHSLNEKTLSIAGFSHTMENHTTYILKTHNTKNRQKLSDQIAFSNRKLIKNPGLTGAKASAQYYKYFI